jgi:hypothetical protein
MAACGASRAVGVACFLTRLQLLSMAAAVLLLATAAAASRVVTISNAEPRLSTTGAVVDAHSGNVVGPLNGTYFLYGEWYGEGNYVVAGNTELPKLAVYTSTDLTSGSWEFRGLLHNNTEPGWAASPAWPWQPHGTFWSPSAVWSEARQQVVLYFAATQAACCTALWGVATSDDGVHFDLVTMTGTASLNASLDGSALFIDDDGTGYVAYDAMNAPGLHDHVVAIDRLSPDLLSSSGERVALMPDYFVEGVMLFARGDLYYVVYGSCCCACREGSGAVVLTAPTIKGPWARQPRDVNCKADAAVCAGMPSEQGEQERPTGQLTISAQGLGLSVLAPVPPAVQPTVLWHGQRWLSAPGNPPGCETLCKPAQGACAQPLQYDKGADFDYWIPLDFGPDGAVLPFQEFVGEFNLTIA